MPMLSSLLMKVQTGACYHADILEDSGGSVLSLERLSRQPGGFQVRHRSLGVYQGSAIELAFWHPSSAMPEYGLCRFSTREKAQALVDFLTSSRCAEPLDAKDLTIEPYDLAEHERLTTEFPLPSAWEQPT